MALIVGLLGAPAAATLACQGGASDGGGAWLETRKPTLADDARLASGFGMQVSPLLKKKIMHPGIDWAARAGAPVIAASAGEVIVAERQGAYGLMVVIDHGGGWQTLYAHLRAFSVKVGDCVSFGTVIGEIGSTGLASGPHLHFEVLRDGMAEDPQAQPVRNQTKSPGRQ